MARKASTKKTPATETLETQQPEAAKPEADTPKAPAKKLDSRTMRGQLARKMNTASSRMTTAIVIRPYTLEVYQRVAGLRGAQGASEDSDAGIRRPYSVSALIREVLEAKLPDLEAELKRGGINLASAPSEKESGGE